MNWFDVVLYNMIFWPAWIALSYTPQLAMEFILNKMGED